MMKFIIFTICLIAVCHSATLSHGENSTVLLNETVSSSEHFSVNLTNSTDLHREKRQFRFGFRDGPRRFDNSDGFDRFGSGSFRQRQRPNQGSNFNNNNANGGFNSGSNFNNNNAGGGSGSNFNNNNAGVGGGSNFNNNNAGGRGESNFNNNNAF
ncbi:unnamed protein product [Brachionus calyciflorus]|uniref:Uncharacterized protein n=1 Tax=Brachionus calyciflorus TaxID=104777 RepID=A0A813XAF8_9BILA|nr:unnamed protein product [Brachionus calyciflorus]